ncbi:MAG: hypothetical protein V1891_02050 [bacterium]
MDGNLNNKECLISKFFNNYSSVEIREKLEALGFIIIEEKEIDFKVKLPEGWDREYGRNQYHQKFKDFDGIVRFEITWYFGWVILQYNKKMGEREIKLLSTKKETPQGVAYYVLTLIKS